MKKVRFSEEQIIGVLKQQEAGRKVPDLPRELSVSEAGDLSLQVEVRQDGSERSATTKVLQAHTHVVFIPTSLIEHHN